MNKPTDASVESTSSRLGPAPGRTEDPPATEAERRAAAIRARTVDLLKREPPPGPEAGVRTEVPVVPVQEPTVTVITRRPETVPGRPPAECDAPEPAPGRPPEVIPARMLNEFVYCPRLFYYEFVESVFVENADTLRGDGLHRRVDRGRGALPPPAGRTPSEATPTSESAAGETAAACPETIHSH